MSTFLAIMQAATRIRIRCIFFVRFIFMSFQNFQETVTDGVTSLLKHRAIVHRTLLNAIADVS